MDANMMNMEKGFNPEEGTIFFKLNANDIPSPIEREITLWQNVHEESILQIVLNPNNVIRFYHSDVNTPARMAEIDITKLIGSDCTITATWSHLEDYLYAGIIGTDTLSASKAHDYPNIKLRTDNNGQLYRIGDVGVEVGYYAVRVGNKMMACSTPKEVFDFQLTKIDTLLKLCSGLDFFTESILVQQAIVMMTTAFEVYTRDRFVELSMKDGSLINLDAMYAFVPVKYRQKVRNEIESNSKKVGEQVQQFVDERHINFQDWSSFKDVYKKAYGIRIFDLGMDSRELDLIQNYIRWRHRIIHAGEDMAALNMDEVPKREPIFAKKKLGEDGVVLFRKIIQLLHERTVHLIAQPSKRAS